MSNYSTPKVFVAACTGMGFFGVAMLSLGPILGQLNALVEGANSLPSTMSLGIILGTIVFGPIVERFGYKWLLILSSLCLLAGLQGLASFAEIGLLHASMFLVGLGGGILNGETNALVSDIYGDSKRGGRLGILGAFYCLGALGWTLLNYFCPDYHLPLNCVSVLMAAFIVWFVFTSFPAAQPQARLSWNTTIGLLKYPALIVFALVFFFQSGFEGISGSFTVSYLTATAGMEQASATLSMTWFMIGMFLGRLALGKTIALLKEVKTFYLYLALALAGVAILFASTSALWVYASTTLIGFGAGATFPVIINFIAETFRSQAPTALSIAMFVGLCGQPTFNKAAGIAFDHGQYSMLPTYMAIAVIAMMVIVPVALKIAKSTKNKIRTETQTI